MDESKKISSGINAVLSPQIKARMSAYIGRGVKSVYVNDSDELIFLMTDGQEVNLGKLPEAPLPIASADTLGGIKVGENLKISADGVLSVDTAKAIEEDNTKPVTSAAVFTEVGNIEVLLSKL